MKLFWKVIFGWCTYINFFFFSWNLTELALKISAISVMLLLIFQVPLHPGKRSFSELHFYLKYFTKHIATDLWDSSCFWWVVKMLLPRGKTMYFFEICWLNSYPASLTVHYFPFLTGMLASARWFPINTKWVQVLCTDDTIRIQQTANLVFN